MKMEDEVKKTNQFKPRSHESVNKWKAIAEN